MGSSGSGRISDYPGSSKGGSKTGGAGSGGGSGQVPEDRCGRALAVVLEDIEHSDYFVTHRTVPPAGTVLRIQHKKRLAAVTEEGEVVGNLPTGYNYLAACLKEGWSYIGTVRSSTSRPPIASVSADFIANSPA